MPPQPPSSSGPRVPASDRSPPAAPPQTSRQDAPTAADAPKVNPGEGTKAPDLAPGTTTASPEEEEDSEPLGCFGRFRRNIEQQPDPKSTVPYRILHRKAQVACSGCCAVLALAMAAVSFMATTSTKETIVNYERTDAGMLTFSLDEELEGDILFWYELPEMFVNHKRFIENKADPIWGNLMATYKCDDAEDIGDWEYRRKGDENFLNIVRAQAQQSGGKVHPCGLVSLSFPTDRYELHYDVTNDESFSEKVELDESDLALPNMDYFWEDRLKKNADAAFPYRYGIKDESDITWIADDRQLEHYRVWVRTPPSPNVRHLWASIDGPLPAGKYRLTVTDESPIFTGTWLVPEKRIILSEAHALGSQGATRIFAILCAVFCGIEVLMTVLMFALPEGEKPSTVPFR